MRVKLVKLRESMGYTQKQMSDITGISRSHYSQIETGEKTPSLEFAMRIKQAVDYPGDDLFFNSKRPAFRRGRR